MPIYMYKCNTCGEFFEKFAPMEDFEKDQPCECSGDGKRCISLPNTDMVANVRYSETLGVHPDQVADGSAFKMHPGASFDAQGRLRINNRKEKLQRIKERNEYLGTHLAELS